MSQDHVWSEEAVLSRCPEHTFGAYCLGPGGIFSHSSKTSFLSLAFFVFSPMISWQRKLSDS